MPDVEMNRDNILCIGTGIITVRTLLITPVTYYNISTLRRDRDSTIV
jgi:hypothetical protein